MLNIYAKQDFTHFAEKEIGHICAWLTFTFCMTVTDKPRECDLVICYSQYTVLDNFLLLLTVIYYYLLNVIAHNKLNILFLHILKFILVYKDTST